MNDQEKWTPLTTFITPFAAFHESFIHYAFTFSVHWSMLLLRLPAVVVVTVVAGRQNIEFGAGAGCRSSSTNYSFGMSCSPH